METAKASAAVEDSFLTEYYSAAQLRADRWSSLKNATSRLVAAPDNESRDAHAASARMLMTALQPIEMYWAYPGRRAFANLHVMLDEGRHGELSRTVACILRSLVSGGYRRRHGIHHPGEDGYDEHQEEEDEHTGVEQRPYFELLIVDRVSSAEEHRQREALHQMRKNDDKFIYEPLFVPSFEDALISILFNHNIQSVLIRPGLNEQSSNRLPIINRFLKRFEDRDRNLNDEDIGPNLCRMIHDVRPELDVFLVTDRSVETIAGMDLGGCKRVFYNQEDYLELHPNLLRGINARYQTPFFSALREYSKQPTGVFHAMPISRGKSISKSHWIRDMEEFYGRNIFMAETSATSGGLDSLLEPHGTIKRAQELASRAFGSKHTFFATNGTSTCNKIVVQAVIRPGDIVLVDRDCHKSHHYGMVLSGSHVVYLDSYPLTEWSMYGAVPLEAIKRKLLELKAAGKIDRVRMLLLTNCTFDGIVYNVERVMEECLAIKPDLVFLWDEAWFAFARFGPSYRRRTAMHMAAQLRKRYAGEEYRQRWEAQQEELAGADTETLIGTRLLPDPDQVRVRVYSTQSTHKTLTALRQGSMIHVHDQDFSGEVAQAFHEAYMTHTSTSPNYQIIASLDIGRRQVELEGFELVQKQVEAAMAIRRAVSTHPLLKRYFRILTVADMIPAQYRESGIESYWDPEHGWTDVWQAWGEDEFALDATRITLAVGSTGYDGDTFKNEILMDRHGIQINKTSRNTVLFMTNIGTTRSSVAYLIGVLVQIAQELDEVTQDSSHMERTALNKRVAALMEEPPPLPDFSHFHAAFRPGRDDTGEGDLRKAFFLAYEESLCEYYPLEGPDLDNTMESGVELVSSSFIIPYPPGFPILVPGQVISPEIIRFMRALDVKEIHGYRSDLGLRVFTQTALDEALTTA